MRDWQDVKRLMRERRRVFLIEYLVCSAFAVMYMLSLTGNLLVLIFGWLFILIGPFAWLGTGFAYDRLALGLIIVTGIPCITAYLVRPNKVTAVITFVGMAGWFYMAIYCAMGYA